MRTVTVFGNELDPYSESMMGACRRAWPPRVAQLAMEAVCASTIGPGAGQPVLWMLAELGTPHDATRLTQAEQAGEAHRTRHPWRGYRCLQFSRASSALSGVSPSSRHPPVQAP